MPTTARASDRRILLLEHALDQLATAICGTITTVDVDGHAIAAFLSWKLPADSGVPAIESAKRRLLVMCGLALTASEEEHEEVQSAAERLMSEVKEWSAY